MVGRFSNIWNRIFNFVRLRYLGSLVLVLADGDEVGFSQSINREFERSYIYRSLFFVEFDDIDIENERRDIVGVFGGVVVFLF